MTAVHLRIAAIYGNVVGMRCVARLGDAAVEIPTDSRTQTGDTRELITCVFDRFLIRRDADIRLAFFICAQSGLHRTDSVCAAEVDAVIVPHQSNVASVAARRQRVPVDLGLCAARDVQHRSIRSNIVRVEVHILEALDALRRVLPLHIQRVARTACLRAALDRAVHRRTVNVHRVVRCCRSCAGRDIAVHRRTVPKGHRVMRRRTARRVAAVNAAVQRAAGHVDLVLKNLARPRRIAAIDGIDRAARDVHDIFLDVSRTRHLICDTTIDLVRDLAALDRDRVFLDLPRSCIGIAAVEIARLGCAVKSYLVLVAAIPVRRCCACSARPAAVHIRMVVSAVHGNGIMMRRITADRASAPCVFICAVRSGRRCRLMSKGIPLVGDLVRFFRKNELLVRIRHGLDETIVAIQDVNNARCLLKQCALHCVRTMHIDVSETADRRFAPTIQRQEGRRRIHVLIETEVDLGKIVNVGCPGVIVDVQRIARHVVLPIRRTAAAVDDACDAPRIVRCPIADIDGVPRRVSAK